MSASFANYYSAVHSKDKPHECRSENLSNFLANSHIDWSHRFLTEAIAKNGSSITSCRLWDWHSIEEIVQSGWLNAATIFWALSLTATFTFESIFHSRSTSERCLKMFSERYTSEIVTLPLPTFCQVVAIDAKVATMILTPANKCLKRIAQPLPMATAHKPILKQLR